MLLFEFMIQETETYDDRRYSFEGEMLIGNSKSDVPN